MTTHKTLQTSKFLVSIFQVGVPLFTAMLVSRSVQATDKWAVLIGIDNYANAAKLNHAVSDQSQLYQALIDSGFDKRQAVLLSDRTNSPRFFPSMTNIRTEIGLACGAAEKGDVVLIYFSGHGRHIQGKSYICATDSDLEDPRTMISVDWIYNEMRSSHADLKIVVIDACRNVDPLLASNRDGGAQAFDKEMEQFIDDDLQSLPEGLIVLHSCSKGEKAKESQETGGVFTHFLLKGLSGEADRDQDLRVTLGELMDYSRRETRLYVKEKFRVLQRPTIDGSFTDEAEEFELRRLSRKAPGLIASNERSRERMDTRPPDSRPGASDYNPTDKVITNRLGMKLVLIPAGTFMMGSPDSDKEADIVEKPQHRVTISRSFYMGETEVTQGQWKAVMGTEPWKGKGYVREGANYPATGVSWDDAVEYCQRLSQSEGRQYRLPTEAEWEYACRGGSTTKYSFGDNPGQLSDYAWWGAFDDGNAKNEQYAHQVKQKLPNPFGLYDMHGNVWEWCSDRGPYIHEAVAATDPQGPRTGDYRVVRGGCWLSTARYCRSANWRWYSPDDRNDNLGFRLVSVSGQ